VTVGETFRTSGSPAPTLLAVVGLLGVVVLAGTAVFWPVETTDYEVDVDASSVDADAVDASAVDADSVIAFADLPPDARTAVQRQVTNPESRTEFYRESEGEIRSIQGYEYVSYEGGVYAYEVENDHDAAMAFGRGALVGLGALCLVYAVTAYATDRVRPLTAASGLVLPVAVAVALVGTYGADLLLGGPGNTLPTPDSGATYFLALAGVLSVGVLGARSRFGFHWILAGIFVSAAGFVLWEGAHYIVDHGAPVYLWLVLAVLAGIALVGVLLPVVGLGYLLAAPAGDPG
jgi:hypothetical protein